MKAHSTIFVVDDDVRMLAAIGDLLRAAKFPVQVYASPRRFLEQYDPSHAGCVICDFAMPGLDGLALQRALKARGGSTPIIFLSGHGTVPRSVAAMKEGAVDFLTKPHDVAVLVKTVQAALARDTEQRAVQSRIADLTPRECAVLRCVAEGRLNKEIASDLGVSERTIKFHRGNLVRKVGVASTAQLTQLAIEAGLTVRSRPSVGEAPLADVPPGHASSQPPQAKSNRIS